MKLLIWVALAVIGWRLITGHWPPFAKLARMAWRAPGPSQDGSAQARALLGVTPDADPTQILAAHRRLIARVHPDRGGSGAQVHAADAARDLLLAEAAWARRGPSA